MALTLLLQSPSITAFNPPSSPDPTPLRMLAFSVAEAALQQDPNSPMFGLNESVPTQDVWGREAKSPSSRWSAEPKPVPSIAARRGKPLWEMVDKARERRDRERCRFSDHTSAGPRLTISISLLRRLPASYFANLARQLPLHPAIEFAPRCFGCGWGCRTIQARLDLARFPPQAVSIPALHSICRTVSHQVDLLCTGPDSTPSRVCAPSFGKRVCQRPVCCRCHFPLTTTQGTSHLSTRPSFSNHVQWQIALARRDPEENEGWA